MNSFYEYKQGIRLKITGFKKEEEMTLINTLKKLIRDEKHIIKTKNEEVVCVAESLFVGGTNPLDREIVCKAINEAGVTKGDVVATHLRLYEEEDITSYLEEKEEE